MAKEKEELKDKGAMAQNSIIDRNGNLRLDIINNFDNYDDILDSIDNEG